MVLGRKKVIWIVLLVLIIVGSSTLYYYRYTVRYYAVSAYYHLKDYRNQKGFHQVSPSELTLPFEYTVYGVDVSHYQQKIDWEEVKKVKINETSVQFAFIKASEGSQWKDPFYKRNYKRAKKNGLIVGAYHYYQPQVHSDEQLNNFTSMVKLSKGDFVPVLDVEEIQDMSKERFQLGVLTLLKKLENHYGHKPILYTNQDYYFKYFMGSEFDSYPVWIAYFNYREPGLSKDKWSFWQFSDKGRMLGIPERVDLNLFKGNVLELNKFRIK